VTAPTLGMGMPPDDSWIARELKDLQRQIVELRAARTLEAATIGAGGITVDGGSISIKQGGAIAVYDQNSGRLVFYVGRAGFNSTPAEGYTDQMVVQVFRDDGSAALQLADLNATPGHAHQQAWQSFDRTGHVVMADDTNSGTGLARPYLSLGQFEDISAASIPVTTSATFVDLQWTAAYRQHPKANLSVIVYSSDGATTGTVQIADVPGNVIGSPLSVTGSEFTLLNIGPTAWPTGSWSGPDEILGGPAVLKLQAKRTAGTGNIGAKVIGAYGVQS
jgi:hypothetical protein